MVIRGDEVRETNGGILVIGRKRSHLCELLHLPPDHYIHVKILVVTQTAILPMRLAPMSFERSRLLLGETFCPLIATFAEASVLIAPWVSEC